MRCCAVCDQPLPAQVTGRPRQTHDGACAQTARRDRDRARLGIRNPRRQTCRLCGADTAPDRLYYCSPDHAERYDALNREQRAWLRLAVMPAGDTSPASATEITPDMPSDAVRWRLKRRERLARTSRPTAPRAPSLAA